MCALAYGLEVLYTALSPASALSDANCKETFSKNFLLFLSGSSWLLHLFQERQHISAINSLSW